MRANSPSTGSDCGALPGHHSRAHSRCDSFPGRQRRSHLPSRDSLTDLDSDRGTERVTLAH